MYKLFLMGSQKLALGITLSLLTSSAFAAGQQCKAYYIQLIVTSVPAKATQMKNTFNRAGFNTTSTAYNSNGKTLYRLQTGPYDTRNVANQKHQQMKSALRGNSTAQGSIIKTGTKPCGSVTQAPKQQQKQNAAYLQNATQCYHERKQNRTTAIQLTDKNGKIDGFYFSRPDETDGAYGYITGTRSNNTIKGKFHYTVEGDTGSENLSYRLEQQLLVDGQYHRYKQVSCASVKEEIDVAKDIARELKGGGQNQTESTDRTSLRFNQFKASAQYTGKNHALVMDEFGRQFRTRLKRAIKNQKPSFAGHYLVTSWGCGSSGCNTGAVINAKTGVATPFPVSVASVFPIKEKYKNEDGQEQIYQLNSRLMIFAGNLGTENSSGSDMVEFYEFKNGKFIFLEARPYGRSVNY